MVTQKCMATFCGYIRSRSSPMLAESSPTGYSPSPSPRWSASPHHYSPGYPDVDPHGGFNPNVAFPHGAPAMYNGSPGYATVPSMRRPFNHQDARNLFGGQAGDSFMDELITTGSMAAAACPGFLSQGGEFFTQSGGENGAGGGSGGGVTDGSGDGSGGDTAAADDETQAGEDEGLPAPTGGDEDGNRGRKKGPKAPKAATEPRIKWSPREDVLLAEAWKLVSFDGIIGANQNMENYWKRVKTEYDERRTIDPDFHVCVVPRGEKAISNHWAVIQQACNKWHGITEEVAARPKSGNNADMEMARMFEMYRADEKADFKFLHVFVVINLCEKWAQVRRNLGKGKTYVPDDPMAGASDGRPDGHKKSKAARDAAPAVARLQASIDVCMADAQANAAAREQKSEARWKVLVDAQQVKLALLKTNTAAKKRNNDLAFLTAGNPDQMDPKVRAWFLKQRREILNEIIPDPAPTTATSGDTSWATATPSPGAETAAGPSSAPTATIDIDDDAAASPAVQIVDDAAADTPMIEIVDDVADATPETA